MDGEQEKKKVSVPDRILTAVFSMIIVVSLVCVAGVYTLNTSFLQSREEPGEGEQVSRAQGMETPAAIRHKTVNILVAGIDYTEKAGANRGKLTDMIMLVSYDIDGKNVDILQIPRDTYVGDYSPTGKINAIYGSSTSGGINGLLNKINVMFQIPIDNYVTVNMDGFVHIVDAIGGVEVDVPTSFTLEGVTIQKGPQLLDGLHAEKFVRERHAYADADLGRIRMQQLFLEALIEKVFSLSASQVASLAATLLPEVTTDFTLSDVLGLYQDMLEVDRENIRFHMLPNAGAMINGQSVLSIERYPAADMLNEYFRPYQAPVPAENLAVIELVSDYAYTPPDTASSQE